MQTQALHCPAVLASAYELASRRSKEENPEGLKGVKNLNQKEKLVNVDRRLQEWSMGHILFISTLSFCKDELEQSCYKAYTVRKATIPYPI